MASKFVAFLTLACLLANNDAASPLQTVRERGFPIPEAVHGVGPAKAQYSSAAGEHRLPGSIAPSHYSLTIVPILDRNDPTLGEAFGTAPGDMTIDVDCVEPTSSVTLHASREFVKIAEESVKVLRAGIEIPVEGFEYVDEYSFFTIKLGSELAAGEQYQIRIDFNTTIATDRHNGLYLTQYVTPDETEPSLIAVTTFAPSSARQAFPCFDEPALKATFQITIGRKDDYISLSNTQRISEDPDRLAGWIFDTYARTVKMSTYLAIVFVAQYDYKEAELKLPGSKPVRIYAPPYMIAKNGGDYAAGLAQGVMTHFEELLGIDYKLSKYDSAAIPDFMYNAMENYGLVTYRTPSLMFFDGETTESQRKSIARVMAHESAHHWFGNLITMRWWNQVWLKEGFATYFAPIGMEQTDPEFEPEKGFLNDVFHYSMPFDSDPTYAHPIISSDLLMAPLYDRMNYEKAACMIRMMEGFLTRDTLMKGLHTFLETYSFQAVDQNELFKVLTEQAREDRTLAPDLTVRGIMDTWTQQTGFPLVRVSVAGPNSVVISQERFVPLLPVSPMDKRDLNPNELWTIPITIATQSDPDFTTYTPKFWLMKDRQLVMRQHNTSEWILLNVVDAKAYYRVIYNSALTTRIISQLATDLNVINPLSRSQLIDDYFKAADKFHVSIETALDLTTYLGEERDPHVWDTVLTNLQPIYNMFLTREGLGGWREYLIPTLEAVINDLGIDQLPIDKGNKVIHRLQLLDWACGMDSELCVNRAKELFATWQADPDNPNTFVPLDLQPVIFCAAVSASSLDDGQDVLNFVLERYANAATPEHQKTYLLNALACSKDVDRVIELLEEILDPSPTLTFSLADARSLLQIILTNPAVRLHAFNFVRDAQHLDGFIGKFGLSIVGEVVSAMAVLTNTAEEKAEIENFINVNTDKFKDIKPVLDRALAKIEENVAWMARFGDRIRDWLQLQTQAQMKTRNL